MIDADEDALICDFAEVYHILDYRALPPRTAAVLSCGLGDESRIMTKLSGHPARVDHLLLATIADALTTLVWFKTKDGQKGKNRPKSFVEALTGKKNTDAVSFATAEAFEQARERIRKGTI